MEDRMLKWFEFEGLSGELETISHHFLDLARLLCDMIASGPERTVALRKLLESKDAAVRAKVHPGG